MAACSGRIDYHSSSRRYVLNGGIPEDVWRCHAAECGTKTSTRLRLSFASARTDAARHGEVDPEMTSATCGRETCIVRMNGSFQDQGDAYVRLDLEISIQSRRVTARAFYAGD